MWLILGNLNETNNSLAEQKTQSWVARRKSQEQFQLPLGTSLIELVLGIGGGSCS